MACFSNIIGTHAQGVGPIQQPTRPASDARPASTACGVGMNLVRMAHTINAHKYAASTVGGLAEPLDTE